MYFNTLHFVILNLPTLNMKYCINHFAEISLPLKDPKTCSCWRTNNEKVNFKCKSTN